MSRQEVAVRGRMLKFVTSSVLFTVLLHTGFCDDKFTGPGLWHVNIVKKCPEDNAMPVKIDVVRHKLNRTHDGFDAKLNLDETVDDTYALRADICKEVDGGCKQYQVLAEDSLAKFVLKYAEDNVRLFLGMAAVDPPEFPIKPGEYVVRNFIMNYNELPEDGPYGSYQVKAFIIKDVMEKACLEMHVDFQENDD